MAGEDEDWHRLLEQYLPPPDPRRDMAAPPDPGPQPDPDPDPDDAPWRTALRAAAQRGPVPGRLDGRAKKRRPEADLGPTPPAAPAPPTELIVPGTTAPAEPRARSGQRVAIRSLRGLRGVVREVRDAQALVETEAGRVWVAASELILVTEEPRHDPSSAPVPSRRAPSEFGLHVAPPTRQRGKRSLQRHAIDLHGMLLSEALDRLDEFLYASWEAGDAAVAVVHGKGAGTLRGAVRELLAEHPAVHHCTPAPPRDGGDGMTIATLYRR